MPDQIYSLTLGNTTVPYQLKRSQRRRRTIEVTVDAEGGIRVAAPMRVPLRSIEDFLARRSAWLSRQLGAHVARADRPRPQYVTGETVPFLGERLAIVIRESVAKTAVRPLLGALEVTIPPGLDGQRESTVVAALEGWYRRQAEAELRNRVAAFAPVVEARQPEVLVRSQKHLWGSCSPGGVLRFNWRLIMAPPPVVDYVVVHELCHLRHPHHQKPFWEAVGAVLPDYRALRAQLRRDGDGYRL